MQLHSTGGKLKPLSSELHSQGMEAHHCFQHLGKSITKQRFLIPTHTVCLACGGHGYSLASQRSQWYTRPVCQLYCSTDL